MQKDEVIQQNCLVVAKELIVFSDNVTAFGAGIDTIKAKYIIQVNPTDWAAKERLNRKSLMNDQVFFSINRLQLYGNATSNIELQRQVDISQSVFKKLNNNKALATANMVKGLITEYLS